VLGTPPAFILSQDQTLQLKILLTTTLSITEVIASESLAYPNMFYDFQVLHRSEEYPRIDVDSLYLLSFQRTDPP
jgi:hypothetical protein